MDAILVPVQNDVVAVEEEDVEIIELKGDLFFGSVDGMHLVQGALLYFPTLASTARTCSGGVGFKG